MTTDPPLGVKATNPTRPRHPDGNRVLLGAQIAEDLADYILQEQLMEGDPLPSEAALAEKYDVSQRVVRDALRLLGQHGLLRTQQGKRAIVSNLRPVALQRYFRLATVTDEASIAELIELRLALETKAASLAADRVGEAELAEMRDILARTDANGHDTSQRVALDLAFHRSIVRASGNRFFTAILDALADVLAFERRLGQALTESNRRSHEDSDTEHRAILYALSSGDAPLTEQVMRAHLERVAERFDRRE